MRVGYYVSRIALCITATVFPLLSQVPPQTLLAPAQIGALPEMNRSVETLSVNVHEVNLVLSVTNHWGKFVNSLRPSDLTVLDNGEVQTEFTFFQRQTDLPLNIAIVLDVSSSIAYRFNAERSAIKSFLKQVVKPRDAVMVFTFNQNVQAAIPVANDWEKTAHRIKDLHADGETALYDAVSEASDWLASGNNATRHVMVVISDGEENTSRRTMDEAISDALKAETAIYSVNVNLDNFSTESKQGVTILKTLSDATGGQYFHVLEDDDMNEPFRKIRRELRSQYVVAYKLPSATVRAFHHLQVLVPRSLRVRCRAGYYAR